MPPPSLTGLLPHPGWMVSAGLSVGLLNTREVLLCRKSSTKPSPGREQTAPGWRESREREMGRSRGSMGTGASAGGFSGTCDLRANLCCWLHTSGTISPSHACLPIASSAVPSAWGGQGRSAEGCGNMVPARRACDLPGSWGAPGTLPCLCSSFFFFSTFRFIFFPPLLPAAYAALPPLPFHPQFLS